MNIPNFGTPLTEDQINFLQTLSKSCRNSILQMVTNAQSGHPGGSLSSIDYLATIYAYIISQTGEKVVVSHGHISPAVYSILGEMGYIPKQEVVDTFRKSGSIYEGHITRHVNGIWYGTGPLGIGVSVASAFALGEKLKKNNQKVYALMGDGECQEGQVHEMIHFAKQHNLNNLVLFIDYNKVQLTASLQEIIDIDIEKTFLAGHWQVININAHDYSEIWNALTEAQNSDKPVAIIGHSIMGQGIDFMQETGENHKADWHGKAPKPEQITEALEKLTLTSEEQEQLTNFCQNNVKWQPRPADYPNQLSKVEINQGTPTIYPADESVDCRTAYGKALLDLAKHNPQVVALTADLKGSVMTKFVDEELPAQHIECGIAEQHMVSAAGGLSLEGYIPFASTFGAFMSSRAKDQARVNDINYTNVKMVATHCGLSVGEDGPTHQAIDDMGSFLGMFNTHIIEPSCPNQTDKIIRYIASHYGNFYVRMGRHKFPIITKENGEVFYDENYQYQYGKSDLIRTGSKITIAATGAMVHEALKARGDNPEIEIIAVSSIKQFDDTLINSIKKTQNLITVEDHNTHSGLGSQIARYLATNNIHTEKFQMIGVEKYQLSGTADELYKTAKIDSSAIAETIKSW